MGSQYFKYILGGLSIVLVYAACRSVECPPNKTELLNKFNQFVNATMQTKQFYSIKEWESKDQVFSGYLKTVILNMIPYTTWMKDKSFGLMR